MVPVLYATPKKRDKIENNPGVSSLDHPLGNLRVINLPSRFSRLAIYLWGCTWRVKNTPEVTVARIQHFDLILVSKTMTVEYRRRWKRKWSVLPSAIVLWLYRDLPPHDQRIAYGPFANLSFRGFSQLNISHNTVAVQDVMLHVRSKQEQAKGRYGQMVRLWYVYA